MLVDLSSLIRVIFFQGYVYLKTYFIKMSCRIEIIFEDTFERVIEISLKISFKRLKVFLYCRPIFLQLTQTCATIINVQSYRSERFPPGNLLAK